MNVFLVRGTVVDNKLKSTQKRFPTYLEDQSMFFDEVITTDWDSYQNSHWTSSRQFEVDKLFKEINPTKILDVGCGCGFHDVLMAEKAGVESVVGIDCSPKSIETANRVYAHHKVSRKVGDIFHMDPGGYDLVVSFQVIEHVTDSLAFLKACASQVHSGGWVAVATPNRERLQNRLRRMLWLHPTLASPQHFLEYTSQELSRIGRMAGLTSQAVFAYGLTLNVPGFGFSIIPSGMWRLGFLLPSYADGFCVVFRR